jgi:hypothetical protein
MINMDEVFDHIDYRLDYKLEDYAPKHVLRSFIGYFKFIVSEVGTMRSAFKIGWSWMLK